MKHSLYCIFTALLVGIICTPSSAETYSGTCGENLNWTLDTQTGVLDITGTGDLGNYSLDGPPWWEYHNDITTIKLPGTLTHIGGSVFHSCKISTIDIPESVTTIAEEAFAYTPLTTLHIPKAITKIYCGAFRGCTSLTAITCDATTPPVLGEYCQNMNVHAFDKVDFSIPIYVPAGSVAAYKAAEQWKDFTNILPIDGEVQTNVYSVCGDLWEAERLWNVEDTSTDMHLVDGLYTYVSDDLTLDAKTYSYKVVVNHSWEEAYPSGSEAKIEISKHGVYQITFTFDPTTKEINEEIKEVGSSTSSRAIYLNTGGFWWGNNDNYYIYTWKDANNPVNVKMEYVADYLYRAYIDKDCTNAYFYYLSADDTFTTIDDVWAGNKALTTIPIDKDIYTITSSWMGVWSAVEFGEWSNYDAAISSVSFAYGQTGEVEYAVKRDSTLEITGSGAMEHYATHQISEDPTFQDPRWYWSPWYCWEYVIKSISLPEGLTTIGAYAFEYTPDVTSVTIPSTVRIIGSGAFNAQNFRSIICKAVTPPTIAARTANEEYKHFFQNIDFSIPLFVPDASVSAYQKAEYWKDFTNITPLSTIPDDEDDNDNYDADAERSKAVMPEAIDLGLPSGMRWSNMNLGATLPDDYGKLYQWGCVTPVTREGWDIYCHGTENQLTKYCTNSNYGLVDNLTTLEPEDDAAVQGWGSGWRMPTKEEAQELWDNCTKTKEERNGVAGYVFTGPNGNSIFLPMVGWLDENGEPQERNTGGRYWTSSLWDSYNNGAYGIGIAEGDILSSGVLPGMTNRYYCRAIRGVLPARTCQVNMEFNVSLDEGNTFTYSGITVTPKAGQHDYSVTLLSAAGCDSTVTWHVTVKPSATIEQYTINVQANDARFGTVSGGGTYTKGTVITLTATPAAGSLFVKWSDGNTLNPRALYVSTTATYTAFFKPVKSSNAGETGGKSYDEKSGVVDPWSDSSSPVSPVIGKEANKVEETEITTPAQKVFINGQLLIIRDGRTYNAQGARVK